MSSHTTHPKDSDKNVTKRDREERERRKSNYRKYKAIRNFMDEEAAQNRQRQMALNV